MNSGYKSTRKNKFIYDNKKYKKHWNSFYGSMFLEDFNSDLSIEFLYKGSVRGFFKLESNNDTLKKMIGLNDYSYLEYKFPDIITELVHSMILKGKAFLEVVYYSDDTKSVKGFDFQPLNYKRYIKNIKYTKFYGEASIKLNHNETSFEICNQNLICFKLSDLDLHKRDFYKIEKKLRDIDFTKLLLLTKVKELNVNLSEYEKEEKLTLLWATKKIPWDGRDYSSKFITEPYQIYRLAKLKITKLRFLEYIISRVNDKINEIGNKYNFSGRITYDTIDIKSIEEIINRIDSGEIQLEDAVDYLLCNKMYK